MKPIPQTDREILMSKVTAHVNRNSPYKNKNPLKQFLLVVGCVVLALILLVVSIEYAQEIDDFFDAKTQWMIVSWFVPITFGVISVLWIVWWVFKRVRR